MQFEVNVQSPKVSRDLEYNDNNNNNNVTSALPIITLWLVAWHLAYGALGNANCSRVQKKMFLDMICLVCPLCSSSAKSKESLLC